MNSASEIRAGYIELEQAVSLLPVSHCGVFNNEM